MSFANDMPRTPEMEHIIDTTPQGSAILAYGKSPNTLGFFKWVLIGFIVFFTLAFLGFWILVQSLSVELPEGRLLMAAIKPSGVRDVIPSGLLTDLPPAWRAAIRTDSRLPVFLGASLDNEGNLHAFALVYRHHIVVPSDDLGVASQGLMKLLTDASTNTKRDRVPVSNLLRLSRRLRSHDASWKIETGELARLILGERAADDAVFGTWDGRQGSIDLSTTNVPSVANVDAPIIVTLDNDRREAEPVMNALASQGIDLRSLSESPSVIFISPEDHDVRLGWDGSISQGDQHLALGALGVSSFQEYQLPDETIVREIAPSDLSVTSVSGSLFSSEGITGIPHSDVWPEHCPGALRLSIEESALQNLFESWNIPRSWRESVSSIQIRERAEGVSVCINE